MPTTQKKKSPPAARKIRGNGRGSARHVQRVIDDSLFTMHFQPIVDLRSQSIFAYEALCRPQDDHFKSPVELISAAVEADKIGELGRLQRSAAVKNCTDSTLFVNLEPHEFDEPWLVRPDDPIFKHRHPIYLEITENVPLKFFEQCHSVLAELRKKGTLLVIDDFGAGFSNLKYIAELQPDIVKLDRDLIQGCTIGSSEYSLVKLITSLCHEMNARVVAEGIETVDELSAVMAAGVDYGQGYLLARPAAPPPKINWPVSIPLDGAALPRAYDDSAQEKPAVRITLPSDPEDSELHAEIKKLSDLLVQSEVSRLALVRRLKETIGSDSLPLAKEEIPTQELAPFRVNPDDDGDEQAREKTPGKTTRGTAQGSLREKRFSLPRLAVVIPALLTLLIAAWVLWPSSDGTAPGSDPTGAPTAIPVVMVENTATLSSSNPAIEHPAEVVADAAALSAPIVSAPGTEEPTTSAVSEPQAIKAGPANNATADSAARVRQIASRIDAWAEAWSQQSTEEYLAFYSVSFHTPSGEAFRTWADGRRQRLARPDWINVAASRLDIRLSGPDQAIATFHQAYSSPGYSDEVLKTQEWAFEYGQWHILSEFSEPVP